MVLSTEPVNVSAADPPAVPVTGGGIFTAVTLGEGLSWEARRCSSQEGHTGAPRRSARARASAAGRVGGASRPGRGPCGPEGRGPSLLAAGSEREGADLAPPRRRGSGTSVDRGGGGKGDVSITVPISQMRPPRRGERQAAGGGGKDSATQAGERRSFGGAPSPLQPWARVWRWEAGWPAEGPRRKGQLWQGKSCGGETHRGRAGMQAASRCLGAGGAS